MASNAKVPTENPAAQPSAWVAPSAKAPTRSPAVSSGQILLTSLPSDQDDQISVCTTTSWLELDGRWANVLFGLVESAFSDRKIAEISHVRVEKVKTTIADILERSDEGDASELAEKTIESLTTCPPDVQCCLTGDLLTDPVSAADGYLYNRKSILAHVTECGTSPITKEPLDCQVLPSQCAKKRVRDFCQERAEAIIDNVSRWNEWDANVFVGGVLAFAETLAYHPLGPRHLLSDVLELWLTSSEARDDKRKDLALLKIGEGLFNEVISRFEALHVVSSGALAAISIDDTRHLLKAAKSAESNGRGSGPAVAVGEALAKHLRSLIQDGETEIARELKDTLYHLHQQQPTDVIAAELVELIASRFAVLGDSYFINGLNQELIERLVEVLLARADGGQLDDGQGATAKDAADVVSLLGGLQVCESPTSAVRLYRRSLLLCKDHAVARKGLVQILKDEFAASTKCDDPSEFADLLGAERDWVALAGLFGKLEVPCETLQRWAPEDLTHLAAALKTAVKLVHAAQVHACCAEVLEGAGELMAAHESFSAAFRLDPTRQDAERGLQRLGSEIGKVSQTAAQLLVQAFKAEPGATQERLEERVNRALEMLLSNMAKPNGAAASTGKTLMDKAATDKASVYKAAAGKSAADKAAADKAAADKAVADKAAADKAAASKAPLVKA